MGVPGLPGWARWARWVSDPSDPCLPTGDEMQKGKVLALLGCSCGLCGLRVDCVWTVVVFMFPIIFPVHSIQHYLHGVETPFSMIRVVLALAVSPPSLGSPLSNFPSDSRDLVWLIRSPLFLF